MCLVGRSLDIFFVHILCALFCFVLLHIHNNYQLVPNTIMSADEASQPAVIEDDSNEDKKFSWPPLESNPEVFTNYLQSIGLPQTFSIGEVFGFDEELLAFIPQPVLGIM